MDTDTATRSLPGPATECGASVPAPLPTMPCSVVWSGRHSYVLEQVLGRQRWVGVDDRGRPVALSCADLERQGWRATP